MFRRILYILHTLGQDLAGAARLAADMRSFLRLTTDFLLYHPIKLFSPPGLNRERRVRVRGDIEITYRLNRGDIWALHEVWIQEIYRMPLPHKPGILVDLGANIGLTALWLAIRYGGSQIIAVEPVHANAELARRNLERNGLCATVIEAAVGATDGTATLLETLSSTNSTVTFATEKGRTTGDTGRHGEKQGNHRETESQRDSGEKSNHGGHGEHGEIQIPQNLNTRRPEDLNIVPVVSMETVLKSLPEGVEIDLLKMDIEGSEGEVLSSNIGWLRRVNALIAEFHPAHADPNTLMMIIEQAGLKETQRGIFEEDVAFFLRSGST